MNCPTCKHEDAYVGFSTVDCLNPECLHFKEEYLESKLSESKQGLDDMLENLGITEMYYHALQDSYD